MASNVTFNLIILVLEGHEPASSSVTRRINARIDALESGLCSFCPNPQRLMAEVELLSAALLLVDLKQDMVVANSVRFQSNVLAVLENLREYLAGEV